MEWNICKNRYSFEEKQLCQSKVPELDTRDRSELVLVSDIRRLQIETHLSEDFLTDAHRSYHVHDCEQEPLGGLSAVIMNHVRVGHHHRLHGVGFVEADGVPLPSLIVGFRSSLFSLSS